MGSVRFWLSKHDLKRIGVGAGVAVAGAILTYLNAVMAGTDFTFHIPAFAVLGVQVQAVAFNATYFVVAGWSIVANVLRKFLADNTGKQ